MLDDLLNALIAVRDGNFAARLPTRRVGVMGEIALAFNQMADTNARMTKELQRVGRVVGREGRMTERASLRDADGGWVTQVESVNALVDDLVRPTTEVARVIEAVAEGDLSQQIALEIEGRPVKGEFLRIGTTVNTMVDQLSSFADEVTRVAREVGTEGKLGGQAEVKGVSGTWRDLTENVNSWRNLPPGPQHRPVRPPWPTATSTRRSPSTPRGDPRAQETRQHDGRPALELRREYPRGPRGRHGGKLGPGAVQGVSAPGAPHRTVNSWPRNLTGQVRNIARSRRRRHGATFAEDHRRRAGRDPRAEELPSTRWSTSSPRSPTRSPRGPRGRHRGDPGRPGPGRGVSGTWKNLTDSVNFMASNLTGQVRNIAQVATAVANGDLSQKISVEAKGEVAALADTINTMVDQLSSFADEVTRVAREVGHRGQARRPGRGQGRLRAPGAA
jgi:HAMP domain-containing protein